ncbi:MAG: hypothetical protein Q7S21_04045 [archaeon]|nr:hypothetical protein [archaeon]
MPKIRATRTRFKKPLRKANRFGLPKKSRQILLRVATGYKAKNIPRAFALKFLKDFAKKEGFNELEARFISKQIIDKVFGKSLN